MCSKIELSMGAKRVFICSRGLHVDEKKNRVSTNIVKEMDKE